ncbi:hypothetical protein BCR32DRAFT_251418 [Anaeromyces robustus]|uniref:Uncharacterized protein n=1 Tax=Anaeromyces robustus TaxID=1754192 RepID=A0A1Y1VRY8_9FUNG|nr:hypothetical protein BCR32DRAFT_251418 [Anaeromyces robustus]|eukprot:ORX63805.1 hypothetical protein BCR32DRAFT_251418 [Anaeromyces robustus]
MLRIGLNDILDEYIEILKAILANVDLKKWKTEDHLYGPTTTSYEYILKVIDSFADINFSFELNSINHIYSGLEKFDAIMFDLIFDSIKSTLSYLVIITIVGVILIIFAVIVGYKMITATNKTLTELVNVIFLIPQSTINMVPQFKRFIETGSFEEQ